MQWSNLAIDVLILFVGGTGTAIWFFWRRKAEQAPVFEEIQKAERLLSLRKDLDNTNYTIEDLKNLENSLMGRAEAAKRLNIIYEKEVKKIQNLESSGLMTQYEMNVAAGQAYEKADKRLKEIIAGMKEFYSPEKSYRFDKTNSVWLEYQILNAEFQASHYEGGSMQPLIYASALEAGATARIVELETELNYMKVR